jgi:Rrf2 family protein
MFNYGLRALCVLAQRYGKAPVSAKEISELEEISPSYLEQLLAQLRRSGLIKGVRGPGGGFRLMKHPSRIKISEIVEALEGPFLVSRCLAPGNTPPDERCGRFKTCPAVPLYKKLERDLTKVLESYKLSDMLGWDKGGSGPGRKKKKSGR